MSLNRKPKPLAVRRSNGNIAVVLTPTARIALFTLLSNIEAPRSCVHHHVKSRTDLMEYALFFTGASVLKKVLVLAVSANTRIILTPPQAAALVYYLIDTDDIDLLAIKGAIHKLL